MSRELILIPKAKYDFLTKQTLVLPDRHETPCRDVSTIPEEPQMDVFEKTLMYAIPKNGQRKATGLWNYIKDHKGSVLNWNENAEIIVKGETIPRSHLVDLLKYTVTTMAKRIPIGYDRFYEALQEIHTPSGFIHHHPQSGSGLFVKGKVDAGPPGTTPARKNNFRWIPY